LTTFFEPGALHVFQDRNAVEIMMSTVGFVA
jgi:hypothetical protein